MIKCIYKVAFIVFFIFILLTLSGNVCMGKYVITQCKAININMEIIHQFITEWTLPTDNITIVLPITQTPDITVDWGDGTIEDIATTSPTHVYATSGTYEIKIIGDLPAWNFKEISTSKNYITQIKQWGEVGFQNLENAFYNCSNINGCIPTPNENSFKNTTDFNHALYGCSGLTGEIPETFFSSCSNVTNIEYIFYGCLGLTGTIPENLFINCSNVTKFSGVFGQCESLTGGIPENLFVNCTKAESFKSTFYDCKGITGSIPESLFSNCPNAIVFRNTFSVCTGLTGNISTDIFPNSGTNVDFYGTFAKCEGITSAYINIKSIDLQMFYHCSNLTNITITDNVEAISSKAFYVDIDTSTNLITNNLIAINYYWETDKRSVQIVPLTN